MRTKSRSLRESAVFSSNEPCLMSLTVLWAVRVHDVIIATAPLILRGFGINRVFPPWTLQAAKIEICCGPFDVRWWSAAFVWPADKTGNPVRIRDGPAAVTEHDREAIL
jgi:hypothetical protein